MRARIGAVLVAALVLVPSAGAGNPIHPLFTSKPTRTESKAVSLFLADGKVHDWVSRYSKSSLITQGAFDKKTASWTVQVWSGPAGEIATGKVDDGSGKVTEAWTGPQVAWAMARGEPGAFGGKELNSVPVWLVFCGIFLLGLADLRRPFSLRNLDLLALLSFTVSLWFFDHGLIFTSVPLIYPGLLYLVARAAWIGVCGRPARTSV